MTNIGIIGTGGIADTGHAPAINALKETSLVAVLSRDKKRGQDFLEKHSATNATVHTSLDSFVADPEIDLVIVCSPDAFHAEQATVCLETGKHVLVEKPITLNAEEAQKLVELAKSKNLVLATGFHLRSHEGLRVLHKQVERGAIGKLRHVRAIWAFPQYNDSNWRAKDDMTKWWSLSAVGSHCIDLTRWFAEDTDGWRHFNATIANNVWNGLHDETAIIAAQFVSGPTVEVVSSVQFGLYNRLELFGDKGKAICEDTMGRAGAGEIRINSELLSFEVINPFEGQLNDLVKCIELHESPRADGTVGLQSVKDLLLAIDG
jgi:predicted dehydrogenase